MSDLPERREQDLRIGNPEREAVVQRLSEALSEGRIELAEYDDRVQQVYAAKTQAELMPVTADLPAPPPPPVPPTSLASRFAPDRAERGWLGMAVMLTAIWLFTAYTSGGWAHFWPIWPIGFTGAGLLVRRINGR
ncbi:MAG: hypothetical protein JWO79_2858 [Actinomycetia bacterium]|nr:hypothetical protein [Actinomycetes bacterium]